MAKNRQFIVWFAISLVAAIGAYAWFFKTLVVRSEPIVPSSYKQFLLENVEGPRILIDSGSNGYHSINGTLMESLTGYPTIVLSDHAGASLHDKIERLRKYGRRGDVVIMPLEWGFYVSEKYSRQHLRISIDRVNFYYHSLSLVSQLRRAYETPLDLVFNQGFNVGLHQEETYFNEMDRLREFTRHHFAKAPSGEAADVERHRRSAIGSNCDDYLFQLPHVFTDGLSDSFVNNLKALSRLREETGIEVILIPPVVVGYDCYEHKRAMLEQLYALALQRFEAYGIPYLEDYQRYVFDGEYFLDTHYHIDEEARDIYTPMIVGDLVDAGLLRPLSSPGKPLRMQVPELMEKIRNDLMVEKMPRWNGNPTQIGDGKRRGVIYLGKDWYMEEDWGCWAKGEEAEIVFCPDPKRLFTGFFINAQYFNGSQETAVYINDQLVGRQDFSANHVLEFGRPLREWMGDSPVVRMRFESKDLKSPVELGVGQDVRPLKFGIHSLELIRE